MRMIGLSQEKLVHSILMQSVLFVAPSCIIGFAASIPALILIGNLIFDGDAEISQFPSWQAIGQTIVIGLLIPILSSLGPILKTLGNGVDINLRSVKQPAIEIIRTSRVDMTSYITFGAITFTFGLVVYYFMPYAMLSFNLGLMLRIFLALLIGLLVGMSMLALNL